MSKCFVNTTLVHLVLKGNEVAFLLGVVVKLVLANSGARIQSSVV